MLFLKVVMVVSKSQYVWVKNTDVPFFAEVSPHLAGPGTRRWL